MSVCTNCDTPAIVSPVVHSQGSQEADAQRLVDVNSEIIRLQAQLDPLNHERITLKRTINARRPILQLPPEISSEIFHICLDYHDSDMHTVTPFPVMSPLQLGMVCNLWRQLAWSTPELWTNLKIDFGRRAIDPVLVDQWLIRSGSRLLSISANLHDYDRNGAAIAIMHIIGQHSERWRKISFDLPSFCYSALEPVKGRFPNLHSVFIRDEEGGIQCQYMFSVAPLLQTAVIRSHFPTRFQIPNSQLTELSVESVLVDECLEMLNICPRVSRCSLAGLVKQDNGASRVSTDQLECLHLQFQNSEIAPIPNVFDLLTTPFLREFACSAEIECVFPHLNFASLVSRSFCSLRTLALSHFVTTDIDFAGCLRALPSLNELTLTEVSITNEMLRMLNPIHSPTTYLSNSLLPNLKVFEYKGLYVDDFPVIASFLESRWDKRESLSTPDEPSSIARLQSVVFYLSNTAIPDAVSLARLQHLVEEGMRISLVTETEMDASTTWL